MNNDNDRIEPDTQPEPQQTTADPDSSAVKREGLPSIGAQGGKKGSFTKGGSERS